MPAMLSSGVMEKHRAHGALPQGAERPFQTL